MHVDEALIDRLCALAHVEVPAEERGRLAEDLAKILDYVAMLSDPALDDDSLCETEPAHLRCRPDQAQPSLPREIVMQQAPKSDEGAFVVPAFVDEG